MKMEFKATERAVAPFRLLLLSDFGAGKTHTVGYLHKRLKEITGRGILMFDFDLGWQTLKTAGFDLDIISYLINPERQGETFSEFSDDFYKYLNGDERYCGYAIDSLTSLQACAMDYTFSINKINRRLNLANENDYGVLVNIMTQVMPQILQISRHSVFIMTAHTRERTNQLTGQVEILPAITGRSLPSQIGGWFNEVYYLKVEGYRDQISRIAQTASGNQVDCKSQIQGMPFELPTLEAMDRIIESYGLATLGRKEEPQPTETTIEQTQSQTQPQY